LRPTWAKYKATPDIEENIRKYNSLNGKITVVKSITTWRRMKE
jgi:hypothetical protein